MPVRNYGTLKKQNPRLNCFKIMFRTSKVFEKLRIFVRNYENTLNYHPSQTWAVIQFSIAEHRSLMNIFICLFSVQSESLAKKGRTFN